MSTEDAAQLRTERIAARLLPNRGTNGGFSLQVDGVTQSHVNPDDPRDLQLEYVRLLAAMIDGLFEGGRPLRALHLGGGALTVPRYLSATRPGSIQHVVELYGELYDFVVEHLPLEDDAITAEFTDARDALAGVGDGAYDLVIVDVFSGDVAPWHISTAEFFGEVKRVLAGDGVVLVNTLATRGLDFSREALATLREVFAHTAAVGSPLVTSGDRVGNVELAAADHPLDTDGVRARLRTEPRQIDVIEGADLDHLIGRARVRHDR